MTLNSYTNEVGFNSKVANGQFPDANFVKAILPPFGTLIPWHKNFNSLSTGNADTDTTDKLVDSTATFITDGVKAGMIVKNTTDDTYGIVDAVDSETSLSLRADVQAGSSTTDVFPLGTEAYVVYGNYELPEAYFECNGQTISDTDSPFNGATLPDINSDIFTGQGGRFIRGSDTSGTLQADQNKAHTHTYDRYQGNNLGDSGSGEADSNNSTSTSSSGGNEARPYNISMVFIMRCK